MSKIEKQGKILYKIPIEGIRMEEILREAQGTQGQETIPETEEYILKTIRNPGDFIRERFIDEWVDQQNGIKGMYGRLPDSPQTLHLVALMFYRGKGWDLAKVDVWLQDHPGYIPSPQQVGVS